MPVPADESGAAGSPVSYRAPVLLEGKTATGIAVPPEAIAALGGGKRPRVRVTIGSYSYRTTLGSVNGEPRIPLSEEHRTAAGVKAGDIVEVTLTLDTEERVVEVPDDLAAALRENPTAAAAFDSLSYSNKRRIVLSVTDAKTAETRQRRIEKALTELG